MPTACAKMVKKFQSALVNTTMPSVFSHTLIAASLLYTCLTAQAEAPAFGKIKQFAQHNILGFTVNANHSILSAQISGQLLSAKPVGTPVTKNKAIAHIDCTQTRLQLRSKQNLLSQRENALKWATKEFNRLKKTASHTTQANLDTAAQKVEEAALQVQAEEIAIQDVQHDIKNCTIRAPFDGTITEKIAQNGSFLSIGSPIIKVLENRHLQIEVAIPIDLSNDFINASKHWIVRDNKTYPIQIIHILPLVDQSQYSQRFRLTVPAKTQLITGLRLPIYWQSSQSQLPAHYLQQHKDNYGIWVKDKNAENKHFLTLPTAKSGHDFAIDLDDSTLIYTN